MSTYEHPILSSVVDQRIRAGEAELTARRLGLSHIQPVSPFICSIHSIGKTHRIPLHRVLRRQAAKLTDRDRRVLRIAEAVRIRARAPELLALRLERLVEACGSGCGGARRRRRGGRRRCTASSAGLALVVVAVDDYTGGTCVARR